METGEAPTKKVTSEKRNSPHNVKQERNSWIDQEFDENIVSVTFRKKGKMKLIQRCSFLVSLMTGLGINSFAALFSVVS